MKTKQSLKAWAIDEAQRLGIKPHSVYMRIARGKYPNLKLRKISHSVVFVEESA